MLGFIFFIIIFVLVIALIVISTVLGFIRSIFGFGRRNTSNQNVHTQDFEPKSTNKSKIFDSNEGEYTDFEELK